MEPSTEDVFRRLLCRVHAAAQVRVDTETFDSIERDIISAANEGSITGLSAALLMSTLNLNRTDR